MGFDEQADDFDKQAGLSHAAGVIIAQAIMDCARDATDPLVLDIGAGTGAIGYHLASFPVRYLGLDLSRPMLEVFRTWLNQSAGRALLARADCSRPWPIADHTVSVVFASRVAHLLDADHVVRQVLRVCKSGGHFILGRVSRDSQSFRSRLQRYKRARLAEHGIATCEGARQIEQILQKCARSGCTRLAAKPVAEWSRTMTPQQALGAWEAKPLLSSSVRAEQLDAGVRADILSSIRDWAQRALGDLDQPRSFRECYWIEGARVN
jgi:SAM-dependent methyltransferase